MFLEQKDALDAHGTKYRASSTCLPSVGYYDQFNHFKLTEVFNGAY
jgi:hypothetical protein